MAPPCLSINASELPARVQEDLKGKRRKLDVGQKDIRLSDCELLAMVQYKCEVQRPLTKESPVLCYAVDRLFRRWVLSPIWFTSWNVSLILIGNDFHTCGCRIWA
jgi:hypothetical protein